MSIGSCTKQSLDAVDLHKGLENLQVHCIYHEVTKRMAFRSKGESLLWDEVPGMGCGNLVRGLLIAPAGY